MFDRKLRQIIFDGISRIEIGCGINILLSNNQGDCAPQQLEISSHRLVGDRRCPCNEHLQAAGLLQCTLGCASSLARKSLNPQRRSFSSFSDNRHEKGNAPPTVADEAQLFTFGENRYLCALPMRADRERVAVAGSGGGIW